MAFFKFRLPGQSSAAAAELSAASADSLEVVRRRARHRLIGSVVLVFVAVVAFPLLFDTQPRPVAVDTPIVIPDRNNIPPLVAGQPVTQSQAPAKPLLPASGTVPAQASLEAGKEEVVLPTTAAASSPVASASRPEMTASAEQAPVRPAAPAKVEKADKPTSAKAEKPALTKPTDDAAKAKALLEGKSAAADSAKVIVQVGAFSDADKVRDVRRKLEQAGFKTYTQVVDGKDGKRTTRVRVGPYESRAEADKAAARIRKLDLPVSILKL